ncbi:molecular chaperone DnaJ [Idiomarina sp. OT37-5b]|uniref:DNA-J related domain-containing protein n=1 Tax=Idiomarina sp. OT37-5b TaxID=2100422 RepID=UPI000CF8E17E|nr:DNA-J related domain-containing protein [Idiomarina sp. OT37-5b]AVJ56349.1 molecular chaperone DnaJ [Idiomarina sp. OT37-5b]
MDEDIAILTAALADLLQQKSQWTEHQLIETLQKPPYELLEAGALRDPLSLFQTHFLIFHCLYRLRADWRERQQADLTINTLKIETLPWQAGEAGLQPHDPLADYYLDLTQLTGTTCADVEALLDDFWRKMGAHKPSAGAQMPYEQACEVMEVAPPLTAPQVKRQYRRLIHRHHPDKGGSLVKMQTIKKAYQTLMTQL